MTWYLACSFRDEIRCVSWTLREIWEHSGKLSNQPTQWRTLCVMISNFIDWDLNYVRLSYFFFLSVKQLNSKGFPINTSNVYCSPLTTEYVGLIIRKCYVITFSTRNKTKPWNTSEIVETFSWILSTKIFVICRVDDLRFHFNVFRCMGGLMLCGFSCSMILFYACMTFT